MTNNITIDLNALRPTELADLIALLTASAKEDMEFDAWAEARPKVENAQKAEAALIENVDVDEAVELMALAGVYPEMLETPAMPEWS